MKKEFKQFALCLTEDEIGEALIKVLHKKYLYALPMSFQWDLSCKDCQLIIWYVDPTKKT